MDSQNVELIRHSFARIAPEKLRAGQVFYERLFQIAPDTRQLFVADINAQANKLMNTLGMLVSRMHEWDGLLGFVEDLAERHVAYGVKPAHYDQVGEALVAMVLEMRGPSLDDGELRAWQNVYDAVSSAMIEVAYGKDVAGARSAG